MPDPIPTSAIYAHPCSDRNVKQAPSNDLRKSKRLKGPIYEVILKEFYEDGCYTSARYFEYLVEVERDLIEQKHEIHYVYEDMDLLLQLVDNVKMAEQVYHLDKGHGVYMMRRILYQTIGIVEKQNFAWLTKQLYTIISKFMLDSTTNYSAKEQSSRFVFKYAKFLKQQGKPEHLRKATLILPTAMDVACSERWKPDTSPENEKFPTLHAALGTLLAEIYLIKAKEPGITRKHALKRTQKAIKAIAQVGIKANKLMAFKAFLVKIELLMEADRFDWALKEILLLKESVMKATGAEFLESKLDVLKKLGITLYCLDQPVGAMEVFAKALDICKENEYWQGEGDILVEIGHAQRRLVGGEVRGRLAFEMAKIHFDHQANHAKFMSTKYMIAALRSDLIHPELVNLMKAESFCNFYRLRRWKNLCERFWDEDNQVGYIKQNTLSNISKYSSQNLYRLYNLVLNTRTSVSKIRASEIENITPEVPSSEEDVDLERIIADNLYYNEKESVSDVYVEKSMIPEEEEQEEEFFSADAELSSSSYTRDIEKGVRTRYINIVTQASRFSESMVSRRSTNKWVVRDSDPICCLLREE
ncbi:uncharacterized protein LOC105231307 isoform X1 [Bactrocera dorsalis]|uniref:Uncharacterized protein LOC105231307 isoform X1 n=2 Tax=Bactrocera dorsalis TaxID=27457 RepID=A0A6I9VH89_BACDO|nr:uncharacterized protein LOC105231307 isoform X1 [Bactrocera dorsalis]